MRERDRMRKKKNAREGDMEERAGEIPREEKGEQGGVRKRK